VKLAVVMTAFALAAAGQTSTQTATQTELTALENQFFKAWQQKSTAAVEKNIAPEGVSWSEWGIFDKAKQIENQKAANANCTVKSWDLTDVRVITVSAESALVMYTANQNAVCGGSPAPSPVANSSLWVRRGGRWWNVYRASVFPKK
jgi:hypothetical protein